MPTYGYECLGCHAQFEVMQSIKDAPLTTCETCGAALRKRVYPVGIAFKGSGFYVNDYAPKSSGDSSASAPAVKTETGDAKSVSADTKATETKSAETTAPAAEAKPAAKTEAPTPAA